MTPVTPYVKKKIPVAIREQIWIRTFGKAFQGKCPTRWCQNTITVFDFQAGHNIPESKGGQTSPENLVPICSRCNSSMGNQYTFVEWDALSKKSPPVVTCCC
jgi:5-methylcytosine-specific restriction endonuclease McrA